MSIRNTSKSLRINRATSSNRQRIRDQFIRGNLRAVRKRYAAYLVTEELPGEDINDPPLPRIRTNYCRGLSVARQFGETGATAPVGLNVITPEASEQNARCPVVPTVCGVAVTT